MEDLSRCRLPEGNAGQRQQHTDKDRRSAKHVGPHCHTWCPSHHEPPLTRQIHSFKNDPNAVTLLSSQTNQTTTPNNQANQQNAVIPCGKKQNQTNPTQNPVISGKKHTHTKKNNITNQPKQNPNKTKTKPKQNNQNRNKTETKQSKPKQNNQKTNKTQNKTQSTSHPHPPTIRTFRDREAERERRSGAEESKRPSKSKASCELPSDGGATVLERRCLEGDFRW